MADKPLDLHFWPTPNGFKITIMLEETGLPYNVVLVNIGRGEQFEPDFLAIRSLRDDSTTNYVLTAIESFDTLDDAIALLESRAKDAHR